MTFEEFQKFIDHQDEVLRSSIAADYSDRERILLHTVKLMEEFGELSDEVLLSIGYARKSKLEKHTTESLSDELADVLIVTFLLAKSLQIDIPSTLERKTKKILAKHNFELKPKN